MNSMIPTISVCLLIAALPLTVSIAEAQQPKKVARIAFLIASSAAAQEPRIEAFKRGLRELRYIEG